MVSRPLCTIILREDGTALMTRPGEVSVPLTVTQALDIAEMVQPILRESEQRQWIRAYIRDCVPWRQTARVERLPEWARREGV